MNSAGLHMPWEYPFDYVFAMALYCCFWATFCWDVIILKTSQQEGGIGGEVIRHFCFGLSVL